MAGKPTFVWSGPGDRFGWKAHIRTPAQGCFRPGTERPLSGEPNREADLPASAVLNLQR
jgi:hypothetical protein